MTSSRTALPGRVRSMRQRGERGVDEIQLGDEIVLVRLDVDDAGGELAAAQRLVQDGAAPASCRSGCSRSPSFFSSSREPSCILTSVVVPGSYSTVMSSKNGTKLTSPSGSSCSFT